MHWAKPSDRERKGKRGEGGDRLSASWARPSQGKQGEKESYVGGK